MNAPALHLTPRAYYNDVDPAACEWLRELIRAGEIMGGEVDERSIADVSAIELRGFRRVHFFAGIGGWDYALRLGGWPEDKPVWTGSCPCPPFSSAGKGSECPSCGGKSCLSHPLVTAGWVCLDCGDEWRGDDRHLLPEFLRLIGDGRPASVFGEQVASRDGRLWLHTLRATLEALGYAIGAADLCSACVGAPHIRQRCFFGAVRLAHADGAGRRQAGRDRARHPAQDFGRPGDRDSDGSSAFRLADAGCAGDESACRSAETSSPSRPDESKARQRERGWAADCAGGAFGGLGFSDRAGREPGRPTATPARHGDSAFTAGGDDRADAPDGFWRDADWLHCTDGKWRPVEPGSFPLADGIPGRVGLLRGYGNAINPILAAEFIQGFREAIEDIRPGGLTAGKDPHSSLSPGASESAPGHSPASSAAQGLFRGETA